MIALAELRMGRNFEVHVGRAALKTEFLPNYVYKFSSYLADKTLLFHHKNHSVIFL